MPLAAANAPASSLTALLLQLVVVLNLLLGWVAATGDQLPLQLEACANFTGGTGFQSGFFTFTTPNYPGNYPARSDCVKLIRAEYPHQVVKLDFRDDFFIEDNSQCATDYLEIRDGPYGYSPPISGLPRSRVCGRGPPRRPPLVSTGRYMWLRFRSDDSIEHAGMRAVYSFEQSSSVRQECRLELRLPVDRQEVLTTKQLSDKIPAENAPTMPVDCSIDATAPEDAKIYFALESMQVRMDEACHQHQLTFYDGFTTGDTAARDGPSAPVCKSLESANAKGHLSTTRRVVVRVTSNDAYLMPKFVVVLTVVRLGVCQPKTEFDCGTDQCIDSRLVCNSHLNCPDGRDEANCPDKKAGHGHGATGGGSGLPESTEKTTSDKKTDEVSYHPIILGSIGAGFLILTFACCCVTLKQRLKERRENHCASAGEPDAAVATAAATGLSREPSVRAGGVGGVGGGGPDSPMLSHMTSLHQIDSGGYGPYGKQNGAVSVHQQQHQPLQHQQPLPQPQMTPSRVRVGKFLDPTADSCDQDSPIGDIFISGGGVGAGYRTPPPAAARRLMGGFSKQESSDTAASSSGGAGSSSFGQHHPHSAHTLPPLPPPPPPPPPPPSMPLTPGCGRRGVASDHRLAPSRSIPGHLGTVGGEFEEGDFAEEDPAAASAQRQRWLTKQRSQPSAGEYQLQQLSQQYQHPQQQQQQFEVRPFNQYHYQQQQQQQQQLINTRRTPPSGGQTRKTKMVFQA